MNKQLDQILQALCNVALTLDGVKQKQLEQDVKLGSILSRERRIERLEETNMATLKEAFAVLKQNAQDESDAKVAVLNLLTGVEQQLRDLGDAPTADEVTAVADQLAKDKADMAAAVVAGTPAAPTA